jgi:hypothetical protein
MPPHQTVEDSHFMAPIRQIERRRPTTITIATNNKDSHGNNREISVLRYSLPNLPGFGLRLATRFELFPMLIGFGLRQVKRLMN